MDKDQLTEVWLVLGRMMQYMSSDLIFYRSKLGGEAKEKYFPLCEDVTEQFLLVAKAIDAMEGK